MYSTRTLAVASTLLSLMVLPGCGRDVSVPAADSVVTPVPLTAEQLRNATYVDILDGPFTLVDSRFEGEPFVPGAATRPVVTLVPGMMATGDLTGDGNDEAVVALTHNAGGSGVFMYLAIMRDDQGTPDNIATISLGDRARVTALRIDSGRLVADMVEHGLDDPMCCPTKQVRREWQLQDGLPISLQSAAQSQDVRVSGHLVWGHESRSLTECGDAREGWVINDAGDELIDVYNELTNAPYQPMFVEVRGEWTDAPTEGFGAAYDRGGPRTKASAAGWSSMACCLSRAATSRHGAWRSGRTVCRCDRWACRERSSIPHPG